MGQEHPTTNRSFRQYWLLHLMIFKLSPPILSLGWYGWRWIRQSDYGFRIHHFNPSTLLLKVFNQSVLILCSLYTLYLCQVHPFSYMYVRYHHLEVVQVLLTTQTVLLCIRSSDSSFLPTILLVELCPLSQVMKLFLLR